ncbi:MAG: YbfB/YjiJ family MFS transporter [Mobilicoccus sp.]|nr:YbfB/YjiJ family MFS transporter [Mobilicoccus sp.]
MFAAAAVIAAVSVAGFLIVSSTGARPLTPSANPEHPGRRADLALPVVLTMLMGFGSSVFWTFGRSVAEDAASLDERSSLLFWGAIGAAGVVGALSGDLCGRLGIRSAWSAGSLLLGASIVALPLTVGLGSAAVSGGIFGAVYVIACGLTIELAREAWPQAMGTSTAILFATIAVGQATGGAVAGLLLGSIDMTSLFTMGGALTAIGASLVWFLPCRRGRA